MRDQADPVQAHTVHVTPSYQDGLAGVTAVFAKLPSGPAPMADASIRIPGNRMSIKIRNGRQPSRRLRLVTVDFPSPP